MDHLREFLREPLVIHAVKAGAVLAIYLLAAFAARLVLTRIGQAQGHDRDRIRGMFTAVRSLLRALFLAVLLMVLGVDLGEIPVFLGSLLAVIGVAFFATWSVLSNITAGFILFATRDLAMGDLIRIVDGDNSQEGRIIEFRLWALVLRREDGTKVLYPNNLAIQKPIIRLSASNGQTTQLVAPP
jgi:small-conductance mechanosensitive channel